ncbi:ornithine decarboxylase 1 [Saccoglossus kowalevskii]|uniref:ornithine decarboxylase n=1 Tax=Saccoglossus kowalevskii TaxID=10224 RepID=B5LVY4_SACKO|nr:ornithine decarboxylase 1 [Saccoglossus kowalevskii]ACG76357.1 ornithine decarboxylase [Saccoglossus kowalevskii]
MFTKMNVIGKDIVVDVVDDCTKPCDVISKIAVIHDLEEKDDAFFVMDFGDIVNKFEKWEALLPRVHPFYAVKCNENPAVLRLLAALGTGFDCASKSEIKEITDMGVSPSRIVYANPCKPNSHLKFAAQRKVSLMTFDNEMELQKIRKIYPDAELVLRILTDDSTAQCQLGLKYGCHPQHAPSLLRVAKELGLNVVGVSFHVGSGCRDASAFSDAIQSSRMVFDYGSALGFDFQLLDIGGGYPGQSSAAISFEEMAGCINQALDVHFPEGCGVRIISEPGRYFVASAFTLTLNVIAKRAVARDIQTFHVPGSEDLVANTVAPSQCDEPAYMYYCNDGVYGSFNCLLFDHATVQPSLLKKMLLGEPKFASSLWGPSCDGLDRIMENCLLPELHVGDWIVFEDMGAYTMCAASTFNGFPKPICYYMANESTWNFLKRIMPCPVEMEPAPPPCNTKCFSDSITCPTMRSGLSIPHLERGDHPTVMITPIPIVPDVDY